MGVGQFVAPLLFEFVNNLFGRGPGSFPIIVGGAGMLCIGLLLLLGSIGSTKAAAGTVSK
jgi:hypothetical protein